MDNVIEKLLLQMNIAYAIFDSGLKLIQKSENLHTLLGNEEIDINDSINEIFPEFFGSEKEIAAVQSAKKEKYIIEKVNKYNESGEIIYLDFLVVSFNGEEKKKLMVIISNSTSESKLLQKVKQQHNEIKILKESIGYLKNDSINSIMGKSDEIESVKNFIAKVANIRETTILLTGNSGTGKTLVARVIHNISDRSESPFVEINCASIPSTLIESEIFGHVRGAFTNAVDHKKGLLEEANGGTLFLDEIGELPFTVQPKFLSFLESRKFRQVGSTKEISVSTRIIAATNQDLKAAVKEKKFRDDLYYRINVVALKIPSLSERKDDILLIANNFIKLLSNDLNKKVNGLTKAAEVKLTNYSWPGNIRELRNILERAVIFCEKDKIDYDDLIISESDIKVIREQEIIIPEEGISLIDIEKKYLIEAIKRAEGNQTKAAKLLNLSLDTFRYRIKKHNIAE